MEQGWRDRLAPAGTGSLFQISADGGEKVEVARPDASRGERALRFPAFLGDGRHFLYVSLPKHQGHLLDVYLGSLDSNERSRIMTAGTAPVGAGPDFLLFMLGDRLVAQRFDPSTADLQRFVAAVPAEGEPPPSFTVVLNWQAALRH